MPDKPTASAPTAAARFLPRGLELLHEDRDLLVVNKPAGLLSVDERRRPEPNVLAALTRYVNKGAARPTKRLYAVNRLDREASGLLVVAKSREMRERLQERWHDATRKVYLCVTHGHWDEPTGTLSSYLAEDADFNVYSCADHERGKYAVTEYAVLKETSAYSLLRVVLHTGRKHQIRVHMAETGHPLVGDARYGRAETARLALHATYLSFPHPFSGERLTFSAEVPALFRKLVGAFEMPAETQEAD